MKIGLLGGVFNPPHIGHLLIARQVLDFTDIKQVWLLPVYRHTFTKILNSLDDRLAMTKMLVNEQIKLSKLEIDHQLSGQTIELVPILKSEFPHHHFSFIIGSDQLPNFHQWGEYKRLVRELPFLVFPRPGFPTKPLYFGMKVLKHPLLIKTNISSSIIRQRVKQGLNIDHLVPDRVREYIIKNKLYT